MKANDEQGSCANKILLDHGSHAPQSLSDNYYLYVCVHTCSVHASVCVHACIHVCVCPCLCVRTPGFIVPARVQRKETSPSKELV